MVTHVLAVLGLGALCGLWIWLQSASAEAGGDGCCGGCQGGQKCDRGED